MSHRLSPHLQQRMLVALLSSLNISKFLNIDQNVTVWGSYPSDHVDAAKAEIRNFEFVDQGTTL